MWLAFLASACPTSRVAAENQELGSWKEWCLNSPAVFKNLPLEKGILLGTDELMPIGNFLLCKK